MPRHTIIPPEHVGDRVEPNAVVVKSVYAVTPNPAGHAFPFRVDFLYGDANRFTRETRCTATNLATGQRAVLRLGQLRTIEGA